MKRVFTMSVVLAAVLVGVTAALPRPAGAELETAGRTPGVRTVTIAGRRVVVEVAARRNFSLLSGPTGRLAASVYLATADGGALPGITNVKVSLTRGTARWSPVLALLPTDVAAYRYYVAQGGPTWPVSSTVTATVEIRTNGSVTRFSMPLVITASRDLLPTAGR